MSRKNNFLPKSANHFHGKRFVGHHQIHTSLITQSGADNGLLIQGCDYRAVKGFRKAGLGRQGAMLQKVKRLVHLITTQFIRVPQANTKRRVGLYKGNKLPINRHHGRL